MPEIRDIELDDEVRDRDTERKMRGKLFADKHRGAQESDISVGDKILIEQKRENKLSTPYQPMPYEVVSKEGNSIIAKSEDGVEVQRNTLHTKKFVSDSECVQEDSCLKDKLSMSQSEQVVSEC